jgi:hypothetical protein
MWKIYLKTADTLIESRLLSDHAAAVAAWRELRAKPLDGQAIDLIAAWGSRVFLRHRFSEDPGGMSHVPQDADIATFFFQGAAGANIIIRPSGRPKKGSAEERDWSGVDWSKSNAEIARALDVRPQVVAARRLRQK